MAGESDERPPATSSSLTCAFFYAGGQGSSFADTFMSRRHWFISDQQSWAQNETRATIVNFDFLAHLVIQLLYNFVLALIFFCFVETSYQNSLKSWHITRLVYHVQVEWCKCGVLSIIVHLDT